jgi:serine/threonine protein kinase
MASPLSPREEVKGDSVKKRAAEVFKAALGVAPSARAPFLDEHCGSDAALRREVESLLVADDGAGDFLGSPPQGLTPMIEAQADALIGQTIGGYCIVRQIASGGMGAVFEAMQQHPRRPVALKLLKAGLLSAEAVRRFEYETQVLAGLRHPGIAQIYEAGTHLIGGISVPYFAMELIPEARPITDFAREERLDTRRRLALFVEVCDAVHHGHQRGVIHRDLKPSNILVAADVPFGRSAVLSADVSVGRREIDKTSDSEADTSGMTSDSEAELSGMTSDPDVVRYVKVIDFGVARAAGGEASVTMATSTGQIIGTLPYMSPEQCGGAGSPDGDVDVRSDVYSLGVLLYELLCERLPYDVNRIDLLEAARIIREQPPTRPSAVGRILRGDLETIVLKALDKDRARRYQSADELVRDVRHYLNNEPIEARRDSTIYLLRKTIRRHRAAFAAAAAFVLLVTASAVVAWTLMIRARSAETKALAEADSAKRISDFYAGLLLNMDPWSEGAFTAGAKPADIKLPDLLREAVRRIPASFKDRPDLAASLQRNIGRAFNGLASPDEAEQIFRDSCEAARKALGEDHPATLELMRNLGNSLFGREASAEGARLLKECVDRTVRVLGEDHPQSLITLMSLNWPMRQSEDFEESDQLSQRVVAIAERTLRHDDPVFIEALTQRAAVLVYHQRPEDGEQIARRAVNLARPIASGKSIYLAFALEQLSNALFCQGRWENALAAMEEGAEIRRSIEGENHTNYLGNSRDKCVILARVGRCEEALALARKLTDLTKSADPANSESLWCLAELVGVHILCGRPAEAEALARERIQQLNGASAIDSQSHRTLGVLLALSLETQGKSAEADAVATQALRRDQSNEARNKRDFWDEAFYPLVSRCLMRFGRSQEAEWHLLQFHRAFSRGGEANAARDLQVVADLVALYEAWGKPDKAAEFRVLLLPKQADLAPPTTSQPKQ